MSEGAKGKRSRSAIWEYFIRDTDVPTRAKCIKCGDKLQHSRNTFNLFKHLSKQHPLEYDAALKDRETVATVRPTAKPEDTQPTIYKAFQNRQSYARDSQRAKRLDTLLVNMLAVDMQFASIVENEGFKHLYKLWMNVMNCLVGAK